MNKNNKIIIISSLALIAVLVVAGLSYALFSERLTGETNYVINAGDLQVKLDESKNLGDILQENNIPISDAEGKDLDGYKFSLINNEKTPISYSIYIVEDPVTNKTPSNDIKMYYTRDYGNVSELRLLSETNNSENKLVETGTIPANTTFNYDLKLWLDKNAGNEILGTSYSCHIEVVTTQVIEEYYVESILNGTEPVLTDNLVPVTIEDDGTVLKADLTKNWYSYENKEWANAIVLKDQTENYNVNQEIPEDKIESYFVWIPKYSYQLWDLGNYSSLTSQENKEQEIKIRFGTTNTNNTNTNTNECVTPETAGESGKCIVGDYMTHPAFLAFEGATGFWTGKFETGYDGATATDKAQVSSTDISKIIIKPNVYSWRSNTLGNFFKLGYDYLRNDESHMMKNTEWGAVAYLQHSKYGSMSSLRINNNNKYITGYASTEEPTKGYNKGTSIDGNRVEGTSLGTDGTYTVNYLNPAGTVASTTGNYSGIYDISGGAWEYVMGYTTGATTTSGSSGITSLYSDFFTNSNWNKYYDKYSSTADTNYKNRIVGDAIGEVGPFFSETDPDTNTRYKNSWYKDYAYFANSAYPWFKRGGTWNDGTVSGAFAFNNDTGVVTSNIGFRIVLTPTK